jgi:chemotaxis regulatin CheY-phosphate phosphatase CheZ
MTGDELQTYTLECRRANEIIREAWDKVLASEDHSTLLLIGYCLQRRALVQQLLAELWQLQQRWTASDTDSIYIKRVRFLAKCIERHLRAMERTLKETEVQLHLSAVQGLHGAPEIKRAGGKRFLPFVSAN